MKRILSYSPEEKQRTVFFLRGAKEAMSGRTRRFSHHTMTQARLLSGGASVATINRWMNNYVSRADDQERLKRRGAKRKYDPAIVELAMGYAVDCRLNFLEVSRSTILNFVYGYAGLKPDLRTVSRWLADHGFSRQRSVSRSSRMVTSEVALAAVDFVRELWARKLHPNQILVMDETGLWSYVVSHHTFNFVNLYENVRFQKWVHLEHASKNGSIVCETSIPPDAR